MKQIRIYTLKNQELSTLYFEKHWPKHMISLPKFGISVDSVYLGQGDDSHQVIAICDFPKESNIKKLNDEYMSSNDFKEDMEGFELSNIVNVVEITIDRHL